MPKKIAILGLGWLGLPLAKFLFEKGHEITGSTTSSEKLMRLLQSQLSVRIIKVDKDHISGNWNRFIEGIDVLIINIPPGKKGNITENYPAQVEQIARRCPAGLRVIFVSSTSVYGNPNTRVDENSDTAPDKNSGLALLKAEELIQEHFREKATILRLAGLYGPGRHPGRFLKPGKKMANPLGQVNLVHLDDCMELVFKVLENDCYGEIINGCSDEHPQRTAFYTKAAYALSLDPPEFETETAKTGKIVCNQKSKELLGMSYLNPESFLN